MHSILTVYKTMYKKMSNSTIYAQLTKHILLKGMSH